METLPPKNQSKQLCTIKLVFAVSGDDEAIGVKKAIGMILENIPNAQIVFNLMSNPLLGALTDGNVLRRPDGLNQLPNL